MTEIFVLIGPGAGERAWEIARAETPVIALLPNDEALKGETYPMNCGIVRSLSELRRHCATFAEIPPEKLTVENCSGAPIQVFDAVHAAASAVLVELSRNAHTVKTLAPAWKANWEANRESCRWIKSIRSQAPHWGKRPILIIGAGPSLRKNVHLAKDFPGTVIAIAHTAPVCQEVGLNPHWFASADPGQGQVRSLRGRSMRGLILAPTCRPELFAVDAQEKALWCVNGYHDSRIIAELDRTDLQVSTGGSVLTSAIGLADAWGCSPIVLIGADHALSGETFYAGGINQFDTTRSIHQASFRVPGYDGRDVPTSMSLNIFREWIEGHIRDRKLTIWNCTEGGARIAGAEQKTLAQAITELSRKEAHGGITAR